MGFLSKHAPWLVLAISLVVFGTTFFFGEQAESASVSFDVGLVVEGCNANLVCELSSGESTSNCPSDCSNSQCSNGIDDDGDSFIDYPSDPHCSSALDNSEADGSSSGGGGSIDTTCQLSVSPSQIRAGEVAYLFWQSSGAGLVREILPDVGSVSTEGSVAVSPSITTNYLGNFVGLKDSASCSATLEIEADPLATGVVQFEESSYSVSELDGSIVVGLRRVSGSSGSVTVSVTTIAASAGEGDYTPKTQIITWEDGDNSLKTFKVDIKKDILQEDDEVFGIEISSVQTGVLGDPYFTLVTIADNFEPKEDPTTLTLIKEVSNDDEGQLDVRDFILTINGEQVNSASTIEVASNTSFEISEIQRQGYYLENISGSLSCPIGLPGDMLLSPGEDAVCFIKNNDEDEDDEDLEPEKGLVSFPSGSASVVEGGRLVFSISRIEGSSGSVSVQISSVDGSALAGLDYQDLSTDLTWADGEFGEKKVVFNTWDDSLVEGKETLTLVLSSLDTNVLTEPTQMVVTVLDNDKPDIDCIGSECYEIDPDLGGPKEGSVYAPVVGVLKSLQRLFEVPGFRDMARVGSGIGIVASLSSILTIGSGLQGLGLSILRLISLLLSALGIRKKARPWGAVYDSATKQPLDPAYVSLLDEEGKEVTGAISDIDGRYGFLVKPGKYRMTVAKTNYIFPSKRLAGQTQDELYNHLYFGEWLEIEEEGEVIIKNIPMDPEKFDWNEFAKRDMKVMSYYRKRDLFIARTVQVLFIIGLIFSFFTFLYFPHPYNFIVFLFYNLMMILSLLGLRRRHSGVVVDGQSKEPLSFCVIRIISPESGNEVGHAVTDSTGRYYKLIANGNYKIRIEKKVSEEHFEQVFESEIIRVRRGILNKNFSIKISKKPL